VEIELRVGLVQSAGAYCLHVAELQSAKVIFRGIASLAVAD
jgi:hypothetical protein